MLQRCERCGHVTYPPRDVCPNCWSSELGWRDVDGGGALLAETAVHASNNDYFRKRLPWRIGTVALDAGPTVLAHLHGEAAGRDTRVRVIARTDRAGRGVLLALPEQETATMGDDRQWRELTADPKQRRVLISDGGNELGQCVAEALAEAGAARVIVGIAGDGEAFDGRERLARLDAVETKSLDLTDDGSVEALAAEVGGDVDILINTAECAGPGSALAGRGIAAARDEMERNYFGLLRLARSFAPVLKDRGGDGARAWVNLFSIYALVNWPSYGAASAGQAAAYSLSQELRAFFAGRVKVVNVLTGPPDNERNRALPPPKVDPARAAAAIVHALREGLETVPLGPVAEDVLARFRDDPLAFERELADRELT